MLRCPACLAAATSAPADGAKRGMKRGTMKKRRARAELR